MVVDCCVTVQLLGKALFLHHWYIFQYAAVVFVAHGVHVFHRLHACSTYQVVFQVHTTICHPLFVPHQVLQVKFDIVFHDSHVGVQVFVTLAILFQDASV
jgi:hypothetical protein